MEIDLSAIILIGVIVAANVLVLVKIFYKYEDEEEIDEEQTTLKEFPAVSKSWEEPMNENQKEILASDKYDLNSEIATKNIISDNEKINDVNSKTSKVNRKTTKTNKPINQTNNQTIKTNNKISQINEKTREFNNKMNNAEYFATKNDKFGMTIAKNLENNEDLKTLAHNQKIDRDSSEVVEINIGDKIYNLTLKDNIIFTHNNENYSSYVLDIKHGNVKVKYRSQEKWISISEIKKIL
ncbi:MAG: hypothetical protein FWH29_07990 [Methanobrevibacter sp.]|nr:hypothetical protein [Methanobrevibacter sp.]